MITADNNDTLNSNELMSDYEFSRRLIDLQERFDFEFDSFVGSGLSFSLI